MVWNPLKRPSLVLLDLPYLFYQTNLRNIPKKIKNIQFSTRMTFKFMSPSSAFHNNVVLFIKKKKQNQI